MPDTPPSLDALMAPLESAPGGFVVGQLAQTLDGRIATASGHSHYVSGAPDLVRLHRLRALVDVVVVGAGTVAADDPRLTVRRWEGPNPVRAILDPRGRLDPSLGVFRDGAAPTLHLTAGPSPARGPGVREVRVEVDEAGRVDPGALVALLRARGLERILVEGGGRTVSAFLGAGCLDRLHLTVAPLLLGSGRPSIELPPVEAMDEALRPRWRRFELGDDLVWDLSFPPPDPGPVRRTGGDAGGG